MRKRLTPKSGRRPCSEDNVVQKTASSQSDRLARSGLQSPLFFSALIR